MKRTCRARSLCAAIALAAMFSATAALVLPAPAAAQAENRENSGPAGEISSRVIFTTAIDGEGKPINVLKALPPSAKIFFFYVELFNLVPEKAYRYQCKFFDADRSLVFEHTDQITPTEKHYSYWCWYNPNRRTDTPGLWSFEGLLDGRKAAEATLMVLSPDNTAPGRSKARKPTGKTR